MTRGDAIRQFLIKSVLPPAAAMLLVCIFKSACVKDGVTDYPRIFPRGKDMDGIMLAAHRGMEGE